MQKSIDKLVYESYISFLAVEENCKRPVLGDLFMAFD